MAATKTLTGARAIVFVDGKPVGLFHTLSYSVGYSLVPIDILGRTTAAELVHTGATPVSISASGWRVVGAGPYVAASVPQVQDLLTTGYVEFIVYDRETNQRVAKIHSVKSTGYSTSFNAKSALEVSFNYLGLIVDDESTTQSESAGAADLPAANP